MRLGLIADVHSNVERLDQALRLLEDTDAIICAGDIVSHYRFSNETLQRLREKNAYAIIGNHEKCLLSPYGDRLRASSEVDENHLGFITSLPDRLLLQLDGHRIGVFHGAPWDDPTTAYCDYIYPEQRDKLRRLTEVGADFVILGHTHEPMVHRINGVTIINPGACGMAHGGADFSCARLDLNTGEVEILRLRPPNGSSA